jgi:hypothetical protein
MQEGCRTALIPIDYRSTSLRRTADENGVLTVTIPIAERARPRRIEVEVRREQDVVAGSTEQTQVTSG